MDDSMPAGPHDKSLSLTRYMLVEDFLDVSFLKQKTKTKSK